MTRSEVVECKLPKGRKWSDKEAIKETSPYCARYGGQLYYPHGKYCYFYPIGEDLYIKGMFSKVDKSKQEIVDISEKIGAFETSILPYEDCCTVFTPRHPKVRPNLEDVERAQNRFDFEPLLEEAVAQTTLKVFKVEA